VPALSSVMEDDPDSVPNAGANPAYAMTQVHPVIPLRASYWPIVNGEGDGVPLMK
jgi:hypothetical protein